MKQTEQIAEDRTKGNQIKEINEILRVDQLDSNRPIVKAWNL